MLFIYYVNSIIQKYCYLTSLIDLLPNGVGYPRFTGNLGIAKYFFWSVQQLYFYHIPVFQVYTSIIVSISSDIRYRLII